MRGLRGQVQPIEVTDWLKKARRFAAGCDVGRGADGLTHFIATGWLARSRHEDDGGRLIINIIAAGDCVRPFAATEGGVDAVTTFGECLVASVDAAEMAATSAQSAELRHWIGQVQRQHEAMLVERVVSLGRSSRQRVAHLLCELISRGTTSTSALCEMPLLQIDLANTVGLSLVHFNRVLTELRHSGLISVRRGAVQALDFTALAKLGRFDGAYLH